LQDIIAIHRRQHTYITPVFDFYYAVNPVEALLNYFRCSLPWKKQLRYPLPHVVTPQVVPTSTSF